MKIKLGKIYRMFVNCNQKVFDKVNKNVII